MAGLITLKINFKVTSWKSKGFSTKDITIPDNKKDSTF